MFKVKHDISFCQTYLDQFMSNVFLSQLTRAMAYVTQTSIDPVLTLYNMKTLHDIMF